jgi:clostripain
MAKALPGRGAHEAAGAYDLRRAAEVKTALDALAVTLSLEESREIFMEMRGPGPIGDAILYEDGGPFVDLYDLCRRAADCDGLSEAVRARAEAVCTAVDALMLASFGMSAYTGFEDGKHGVFVTLPADLPGRWRNFTWLTPRAHQQGGKDIGGWAFCADGAVAGNGKVENWFELLDHWFDTADDAGGVNGYRP